MEELNLRSVIMGLSSDFEPIKFEMILTEQEIEDALWNEVQIKSSSRIWKAKVAGVIPSSVDYANNGLDSSLSILQINREEVINFANRMKHQELNDIEHRKQTDLEEAARRQKIVSEWTAERFYRHMVLQAKSHGVSLQVDEDNKLVITALCFYFSKDKRFETQLGFDFNKGLIIAGGYGTGKSFLVRCMDLNDLISISYHSMIEISTEVKKSGNYGLIPIGNRVYYLDDVGTEEKSVHFGNNISWFSEFIEVNYAQNRSFSNVILSTNLNIEEIEQQYGGRVRSRIAERFNLLVLSGKDRRRS